MVWRYCTMWLLSGEFSFGKLGGGEGFTYIRATNTTRKLITSLSSINLRCFFIHHPLANVLYSSVIQFSKELLFFAHIILSPFYFSVYTSVHLVALRMTEIFRPRVMTCILKLNGKTWNLTKNLPPPKKDAWTVWIITKHSKEKNIFAYVIWNKQQKKNEYIRACAHKYFRTC